MLATLKPLDALISHNLALVHVSDGEPKSSGRQSKEDSSTDLDSDSSLRIHDLVGVDDGDGDAASSLLALSDISVTDAPLSRTAQKYAPLLRVFPELQSVAVTRLELLTQLRDSITSPATGIERGPEIYHRAHSLLRGCAAVAFDGGCIHNFIICGESASGEFEGGPCGPCGAGGRVFCPVCRQHFCISCAKASDVLLSVALARSVVKEEGEEEEEAAADQCISCGQPSFLPAAVGPAALLCGTCSSHRCCAHCLSVPSKVRVPRGDPLQKLFCLKCATGAHNLSTLLQHLRDCLACARPRAVFPHAIQVPQRDEHEQVVVAWDSATPPHPDQPVVVAIHTTTQCTQPANSGVAFQSCLILPCVTHINIECKRLNNTAASKTWLSRLASACLESEGREVAIERCRRVGTLSDSASLQRNASSDTSTFEGHLALQGEYPRLVLDIMVLLCIQGAWLADEAHIDNILTDATVHCILRWKPRALPSYCASYAWLSAACLREAKVICGTRAPWHSGCCSFSECSVQPSTTSLLAAWKSAPPGASSQLAAAFSCGHVRAIASSTVDASRCLNPPCATLTPQIRTRDFSIPGVDDNRPPLKLSRCRHCDMPLSLGRSVFDLRDVLRGTLKRERARLLPQLLRASHSSAATSDDLLERGRQD